MTRSEQFYLTLPSNSNMEYWELKNREIAVRVQIEMRFVDQLKRDAVLRDTIKAMVVRGERVADIITASTRARSTVLTIGRAFENRVNLALELLRDAKWTVKNYPTWVTVDQLQIILEELRNLELMLSSFRDENDSTRFGKYWKIIHRELRQVLPWMKLLERQGLDPSQLQQRLPR